MMTDEQLAVFNLTHVHVMPDGEEDLKNIGYYRTEADAREAIGRAVKLPGFKDAPDSFVIERHIVDEDNPREGYGFLSR